MKDDTEWTRIVHVYRDDESYDEVHMTIAMYNALRRIDDADRKRSEWDRKKWAGRKPKNFTDVKISPNGVGRKGKTVVVAKPGRFEGPRITFSLFYGQGQRWDGPDKLRDRAGRCVFCGDIKTIPSYAYCLSCDRCRTNTLKPDRPRRQTK